MSRRTGARRALFATGVATAGMAAGVAVERYLVRRMRSLPDPERDEPLSRRPGTERRVASFDGTELAVNVVGPSRGPALVFAHGFSLDLTAWHYQWTKFSDAYRCILYDQRGHGKSAPAAHGDYSLQALGRDLSAVLDAAAPRGPAVLLGHSMGGMGVMALAAEHPEEFGDRIRAVVLTNTVASDLVREMLGGLGTKLTQAFVPAVRRLAAKPERLYRFRSIAASPGGVSDLAFLVARVTNLGPHAPPSLVDYLVRVASTTPAEVWTDLVVSLIQLDLSHALEHIAVPALVVAGDVDRLTPPSTARALVDRLPDGRLVVLEGSGHCAMLERHDRFNRVVEGFLDDVLVPSRRRARA